MKLDASRVDQLLADSGRMAAVLFHGDDEGLIRELASGLVVSVAGSLDDPFRVSEVDRDGWARLQDSISEQSLLGGRRVVRVRDVTDAAAGAIERCLKVSGGGLLVLEGPGLGGKSRVKTLLERSEKATVVACYPMDERAISQLARGVFREAGITADGDAMTWLVGQLGADRGISRRELEKLVLYVGNDGTLDLDAARLCVGDMSGLSLEDALFAATAGEVAAADRALELALSEGTTPVGVVRGGLMHLQRLSRAVTLVIGGMAASSAAKAVRPPVHFRREGAFTRALQLWSPVSVQAAAARLWEAERACKQTGAPAEVLCRGAILGMSQRALSARRRLA